MYKHNSILNEVVILEVLQVAPIGCRKKFLRKFVLLETWMEYERIFL